MRCRARGRVPRRAHASAVGRLLVGIRRSTLLEQALEAVDVDSLRVDLERVPAAPRHQELVGLERLPQPRDLHVQAVPRRPGRALGPERLDESISRDDLVRVDQEERQQRARLRAPQRKRAVLADCFDGPEQPELHRPPLALLQSTLAPHRERVESDSRVACEAARRPSRACLADADSDDVSSAPAGSPPLPRPCSRACPEARSAPARPLGSGTSPTSRTTGCLDPPTSCCPPGMAPDGIPRSRSSSRRTGVGGTASRTRGSGETSRGSEASR